MNKNQILVSAAILCVLLSLTLVVGCSSHNAPEVAGEFTPELQPLPQPLTTYEPMTIPVDNPMSPEKVALGRQLFFDERLSVDGTRSCYSCVCTQAHALPGPQPQRERVLNPYLENSAAKTVVSFHNCSC